MRKHYLDRIRWATVLLVLVYHVFYLFNGVGILGGIPGAQSIPLFDGIASMIYPWFMVLLFIIAGISARYALEKRTGKEFLRERTVKLLVPSTLGLFVLHWITGYLNIKMSGGLEAIPAPLRYPISAISGIGPLWFIQMLFLFSCLLLLIRKMDGADRLWQVCGKAGLPVLLLLSVLIFGAAQIGNVPVLTMYRFGIYLLSFLIGYFIFSHDEVQNQIERICVPMVCLAVLLGIPYGMRYWGSDYTSPSCLQAAITNLYLWAVVLGILGWGKRYWNRETAIGRYMTRASFGIYILHYPILLAICYTLHTHFNLPIFCSYAAALVLGLAMTFAMYEIIRRIPLLRYLVLGIRQ